MASLQSLLAFAKSMARKQFAELGECRPVVVAETDDEAFLGMLEWKDAEEKRRVTDALRVVFRERKVTHYVMIVEMWMVVETRENLAKGEYAGLAPSERPDRTEAIFIFGEHQSGEVIAASANIARPKDGKPYLEKFKTIDGMMASGAMAGLLDINLKH